MFNYFDDIEQKNIMWQATVRYSDVYNMSEEEKELFVNALGLAVQKVCWDFGLHNQRRIIRQKGQAMSEPMYLQGDEYALKGIEGDIDEDDDSGLPDRMWEDDE